MYNATTILNAGLLSALLVTKLLSLVCLNPWERRLGRQKPKAQNHLSPPTIWR
jgi:hypothetical protein